MFNVAVAALVLMPSAAFSYAQTQREFAAAALAGAACQHVVKKIPVDTVALRVSKMFKDQNINSSIVKELDVQLRAKLIYDYISTRNCLP